jgi:ribosomal protein S18 acetylase RimI-like enzyme
VRLSLLHESVQVDITDYHILDDGYTISLYDDSQFVGRIQLGRGQDNYAYVQEVRVDPSYQRQGYGYRLYLEALEEAKRRGFAGIEDGGKHATGAQAIWRKLKSSGAYNIPVTNRQFSRFYQGDRDATERMRIDVG